MAAINELKLALVEKARGMSPSQKKPLSDTAYKAGFDVFLQGSNWNTYRDFIIPQMATILRPLLHSRTVLSILEVGAGQKSVLGYLPSSLRRCIGRYTAIEPRTLFATALSNWLGSSSKTEHPFPCLEEPPTIHQTPFSSSGNIRPANEERFDVVLFCHSLYGMGSTQELIERATQMLADGGSVVIFHRDRSLSFGKLVCQRTACFPANVIRVIDDDQTLDSFAAFVVGFSSPDESEAVIQSQWRSLCRSMGQREDTCPQNLSFSSPEVMMVFTKHATELPELTANVQLSPRGGFIKNREARLHHPATMVSPTCIEQIQAWVRWAIKHGVGLTVVDGSHSGHCIRSNAVAVDMSFFAKIHILLGGNGEGADTEPGPLVIAEAGCTTGQIIAKAMSANLTVPLGSCPSVGAGLWLQGGIGHLSRLHGLACDAIIGAIMVGVEGGQVFRIGHVPRQHRPAGAVCPDNEADLLWAIKGAGTNFGIVVSVVFQAYEAPAYSTRKWLVPLEDKPASQLQIVQFDQFAESLPRSCSADAYLHCSNGQLYLGVTGFMCKSSKTSTLPPPLESPWPELESKVESMDSIGLFQTEWYIHGMHRGHGEGKTSGFKRCVFLKAIGSSDIARVLIAAIENRPTSLCYLHLLQGGGAIHDVTVTTTAFGCRDWDFACVITGIWHRDRDDTSVARRTVDWVYNVVESLLPVGCGVYGADLGPDPRDDALATRAFGPNQPRLAQLKDKFDPHHVLRYASSLRRPLEGPLLIILVSGDNGAGKDFCADRWVSVSRGNCYTARAISISEITKQKYAAVTGASLERLLHDRAYKEQHRPALQSFWQSQVRQRPGIAEEHFLAAVNEAAGVDVLFITGIRDHAPATIWSPLVPGSRLLDIRVTASEDIRRARRGGHDDKPGQAVNDYRPSLTFCNDEPGSEAAEGFAQRCLLPLLDPSILRLAGMVRAVLDFPRAGIEFRHVLNICQKPNGLALCASLLQSHYFGDWGRIDTVACCEAGGFLFASALAAKVNKPLALIRNAGKLPPPFVSVSKTASHISSGLSSADQQRIEIEQDLVAGEMSIVVVDDVLATGRTLCAVLQLLEKAGACINNVSVMVVVEFPLHRGRELLRQSGFGAVRVQSLLILDGA